MARLRPLQFGVKSLLLLTLVVAAFFGGRAWTDHQLFARLAAERAAREAAETRAKTEQTSRLQTESELIRLSHAVLLSLMHVQRDDYKTRDVLKPLLNSFNETAESSRRSGSWVFLMGVIYLQVQAQDLAFVDIGLRHYDETATWFDELDAGAKESMSVEDRDRPPKGEGMVVSLLLRPTAAEAAGTASPLPLAPSTFLQKLRQLPAVPDFAIPGGRLLTHAALIPQAADESTHPTFRVDFVWHSPIPK